MQLYKKMFFISLSFVSVFFICLYAKETFQKSKNRSDLKCYYAKELEDVFTKGYAVDQKGRLVWGQSQFESNLQKLEEQMLREGFSRAEIAQMKEKGREKGQETRRFWDKLSS